MRWQAPVIVTLPFMALVGTTARRGSMAADIEHPPNRVTMAITDSGLTGRTLEIDYQITNGSQQDIWICEGIISWPGAGPDFEVYLSEDSETLTVRKRLAVLFKEAMLWSPEPFSTYVRLPAGEQRSESITLPLPIYPVRMASHRPHFEDNTGHATRLRIEVGFHDFDLSRILLDASGRSGFAWTKHHEVLRDRNRTAMLIVQGRWSKMEQMVSAESDMSPIPYVERELIYLYDLQDSPKPPEFSMCTHVNVKYRASMLSYFFPGRAEQRLFSLAEREYLESQKTITVNDPQQIAAMAREISRGTWVGVVSAQPDRADVVCYQDDKALTSFSLFGDNRLLAGDGLQFKYDTSLESLRSLTPQIRPYELRVQCARNLTNLWYRFRLLGRDKATASEGLSAMSAIRYAPPTRWTDDLTEGYRNTAPEDRDGRPYKCPSAGDARCHYAMNPACEPNSPGDIVLLFETRGGWNQHGGPELFTFDNHDPKGGCVLLNDGTVKFIRTEEELKQLRWK